MQTRCEFRYFSDDGSEEIKAVYDGGSKELKAKFLSRVTHLRSLGIQNWREPHFKPLHGECSGLFEIRFKADRVQQRPIGYFLEDNKFVILFWAIEKGGKFVPKSACKTANARKKLVQSHGEKAKLLWV